MTIIIKTFTYISQNKKSDTMKNTNVQHVQIHDIHQTLLGSTHLCSIKWKTVYFKSFMRFYSRIGLFKYVY